LKANSFDDFQTAKLKFQSGFQTCSIILHGNETNEEGFEKNTKLRQKFSLSFEFYNQINI
jgi:hypothetical protein